MASFDFDRSPFVVIWETTQACDLACVHCRASAIPRRDARELTTIEAIRLLDSVRAFDPEHPPLFVMTGGDPLRRADIPTLVEYGTRIGLRVALTPSGTPLTSRARLEELRDAGLARLAVSLDGSTRTIHDRFRGVAGSYEWTLRILRDARELDLSTQINSTISRHNIDDLEPLIELVEDLGISLWSVFFIVPTGRAHVDQMVSPDEVEWVMNRLHDLSKVAPFDIKTTAGPHYRRVTIQRQVAERREAAAAERPAPALRGGAGFTLRDGIGRARGVTDGVGFVFVSHRGEIFPSGFLPLSAGNVRTNDLAEVYRKSPLFRELRDTTRLKGKCGACEYGNVCGGSRGRAYAMTGDYMQADPLCAYVPAALLEQR
ncbi:MAG: TIGR04053 family radical SAM/SPASM domain-containing protein [Gemmatimonadaceae bacterium]|nr:TIGR04053 family radical SAM/SPASM domain-containing protein [Gemmatimonadaceae bacterium]NUR20626.1 TIGR04053 family radical SAM/SPASM domain-containing protein [Gemmatimonadaceae bacterium]